VRGERRRPPRQGSDEMTRYLSPESSLDKVEKYLMSLLDKEGTP
jgi:hypothetical protein